MVELEVDSRSKGHCLETVRASFLNHRLPEFRMFFHSRFIHKGSLSWRGYTVYSKDITQIYHCH